MTLNHKQIAVIHVAKNKLELDEQQYRSILMQVAGVASATDLDIAGFEAVMGFMEYLGFQPLTRKGQNYGIRRGMASPAQIQFIRELWSEYTLGGQEDTLNKWLLRCFKISSLRFLQAGVAPKVITALKSMKARNRK